MAKTKISDNFLAPVRLEVQGFKNPNTLFPGKNGSANDFFVPPPIVKMDNLADEVVQRELTTDGKLKNIRIAIADAGKTLDALLSPPLPPQPAPKEVLSAVPGSPGPLAAPAPVAPAPKKNTTPPGSTGPTVKERLLQDGHSAKISSVSKRIANSQLDHTTRYLLSFEPVYAWLLFKAVYADKVTDETGMFSRVIKGISDVKEYLSIKIVEEVVSGQLLQLTDSQKKNMAVKVFELDMPYLAGQVEPFVLDVLKEITTLGDLPKLVDRFFEQGEVNPRRGTPQVKELMVRYLEEIGLTPDEAGIKNGKFDEYMPAAYSHALKSTGNQDDPLKNIFNGSSSTAWDFSVDYFETIEQQGIIPENIRAAGALYYTYVLADQLRILPITDSILMAWTTGRLDIPQGTTATKLYNYYKLREEYSNYDERCMFYKQVLNIGDCRVMDNMAINTEFTSLWDNLMTEVVKFIQKFEQRDNSFEVVSKQAIFQAMKDLQFNLTIACSGMVKQLLPEMYAQLQNAMTLLQEPEIVNQLGSGFNKNLWKVIERVSKEEFGYIPNISAMRTSAVKGHEIFTALAFFDEAQFPEQAFRKFIADVESFILAQSQLASDSQIGASSNGNGKYNGKYHEEELQEAEWDF